MPFSAHATPSGRSAGEIFTAHGAWTILTGAALVQSDAVPGWLGAIGVAIGPLFIVCALEFVGRFEPAGWKLAGQITPIAYIAWSLWLVALGVALWI